MILVTGGTGLVGGHLLYELAKYSKEPIRAIYKTQNSLERVKEIFSYKEANYKFFYKKIQWVKANLLDIPSLERAFEGVSVVYHVAALISFKKKDKLDLIRINIEGTANIVNLCIFFRVKKICYVSSIATMNLKAQQKYIDESSEWNSQANHSHYSISKFNAEMEVWRASQEGEIPVIIVNPGVILGSGNWERGSGKIFLRLSKCFFPFYTNGVCGVVGVEDLVRVMIELTNSSIKNQRYVIVAENISFKELIFKIAKSLNVTLPFVCIKPWASHLAAILGFIPMYLNKSLQKKQQYCSIKIKKAIDFEFTPISKVIDKITKDYYKYKNKKKVRV